MKKLDVILSIHSPEPTSQVREQIWSVLEHQYATQQHRAFNWSLLWRRFFASASVAVLTIGVFLGMRVYTGNQNIAQLNSLDSELVTMEQELLHDQFIEQVIAGETLIQ